MADESGKPISAEIISVTTYEADGIYSDSVMLRLAYNGQVLFKEFDSPMLDSINIRIWRRIMLSVILDKRVSPDDRGVRTFNDYKAQIYGRKIYAAFDGFEVVGVGSRLGNLFFPEAYGMWGQPENANISTDTEEKM